MVNHSPSCTLVQQQLCPPTWWRCSDGSHGVYALQCPHNIVFAGHLHAYEHIVSNSDTRQPCFLLGFTVDLEVDWVAIFLKIEMLSCLCITRKECIWSNQTPVESCTSQLVMEEILKVLQECKSLSPHWNLECHKIIKRSTSLNHNNTFARDCTHCPMIVKILNRLL